LVHDRIEDRRLQLDADDNGIVRFFVKARKEWHPIEMHLESLLSELAQREKMDIGSKGHKWSN
jgi:hypothetical protein